VLGFSRYLLSAGAATLVDVALVQLLLSAGFASSPLLYAAAIILGVLCGMAVNFAGARYFVFATDPRPASQQFISFALVCLSTLLLRLLVAFALLNLFGQPLFAGLDALPVDAAGERLAHIGSIALVTLYSFFAHKHVTFAGGLLAVVAGKSAVRP